MQVLVVLAEAAGGVVTRNEIFERCWGNAAVGDDSLNRAIADIRRVARAVGRDSFAIETVPRTGYRLTVRELVGARAGAARIATRRVALAAALVGLAVAGGLGVWAGWRLLGLHQNGRVAVARFDTGQSDPILARLSTSVPEAISRVLSTAGVRTESSPPVGGLAKAELRVRGSVERDGDRLAANVQVLGSRGDTVLWSDRFEGSAAAPALLAAEASHHVGGALRCALEDRNGASVRIDEAAFGLNLNACSALAHGQPSAMLAHARRLVKAQPRFANAHAMHGIAAGAAAQRTDHSPEVATALLREARAAADRALAIDPRTAKAFVAREISLGPQGDLAARERELQQTLGLEPESPLARGRYATLLRDVGRMREAVELAARTVALGDPQAHRASPDVAVGLAATGDAVGTERELQRLRAVAPSAYEVARFTIAVWWEDPATAMPVVRALGPRGLASPTGLACAEQHLAKLPALQAARAKGLPRACAGMMPDWRVRMLARQGDIDGAYDEMVRPKPNSRGRTHFLFYPEMKAFRADPRFLPLAARLGLLDYWVRADRWPDFCAERDLPYDCRAVGRALLRTARPGHAGGA